MAADERVLAGSGWLHRPRSPDALLTLTVAQTSGQTGIWAAYVAAVPVALAQPHPAEWLSVLAAAWSGPFVLSRLAGAPIDRYGPRVVAAASWALAALAAAVPLVISPGPATTAAVLAVMAAAAGCAMSAGQAAPTWLPSRPDLAQAGTWLLIATRLPVAVGQAVTGSLIVYAGDRPAWALVTAVSAAGALGSLAVPAVRPDGAGTGASVRIRPAVRTILVLTAWVYFSMGIVTIVEPLYVHVVLGRPLAVYGWLLGTWGAAGVVASLAARRWGTVITARWAVPAAVLTAAAGEALYLETAVVAAAFTGAVVFGLGAGWFRMASRAVIAAAAPHREHGRAYSLWQTVQAAALALPAVITGAAVAALGLRTVLGSPGIIAALAALAAAAALSARARAAAYAVAAGAALFMLAMAVGAIFRMLTTPGVPAAPGYPSPGSGQPAGQTEPVPAAVSPRVHRAQGRLPVSPGGVQELSSPGALAPGPQTGAG